MQNERKMNIILTFVLALLFVGCERQEQRHSITNEVRAKNGLKELLLIAQIEVYDGSNTLSSVADLANKLKREGHLISLSRFGETNIFFNNDWVAWKLFGKNGNQTLRCQRLPYSWFQIIFL
jgi:hypothetical protein